MDYISTLLVVVVVLLTVLLVIVGVQVLYVIFDLKKAIKRLNAILEDSILGGGLIRPEKLTGLIEMMKRSKKMESHGQE